MIGMFDSGVGGLAVWELLKRNLPNASTIYIADQAFYPYGEKSRQQIIDRSISITRELLKLGAQIIVVACNTATVQAIDVLRTTFPNLPFVGMEPAIKPAAAACDRILVIGTNATVQNPRFMKLAERYGAGKYVRQIGVPALIAAVERGAVNDIALIEEVIGPDLAWAQTLVIGCTQLSFLVPAITNRWPQLQIFDGRYGTVAQTVRLIQKLDLTVNPGVFDQFYSTKTTSTVTFLTPTVTFSLISLSADDD